MIKKCLGCGIKLQSTDNQKLGFVPKHKKDADLCERCFKIIHYNDAKAVILKENQNKIIKHVQEDNKHVLFLIDLLNINEDTIKVYQKIKTSKTLIISKYDLIPKYIKPQKIINWLQDVYKIKEDILFLSALKNQNISSFLNYLKQNNIKEAYILGFTNAGKSSLINRVIKHYNLNIKSITTSLVLNTTLDFINIKINDQLTLIDSPGFTISNSICSNDDIDFIRKLNPKKYIRPITYQLKPNTTILIDKKIAITNLKEKNSFTFYLSNDLLLTKIYHTKFNMKSLEYDIERNSDIVLKNIGFINVKKPALVKISYDYSSSLIEIRKSIFK